MWASTRQNCIHVPEGLDKHCVRAAAIGNTPRRRARHRLVKCCTEPYDSAASVALLPQSDSPRAHRLRCCLGRAPTVPPARSRAPGLPTRSRRVALSAPLLRSRRGGRHTLPTAALPGTALLSGRRWCRSRSLEGQPKKPSPVIKASRPGVHGLSAAASRGVSHRLGRARTPRMDPPVGLWEST